MTIMRLRLALAAALSTSAALPNASAADKPLHSGTVMTAITEVTEFGKQKAAAPAQPPIRYVLKTGSYRPIGQELKVKPVPATDLEHALQDALNTNGYAPATDAQPATVLVVYNWGTHSLPDGGVSAASQELLLQNVLDRAAFIAGAGFAKAFGRAAEESISGAMAMAPAAGNGAFSAATSMQQVASMSDPVRMFRQRSVKNEVLVDQASSDCYYVIVSAYDLQSVGSNRRRILWRTRMTASTHGLSMSEALPRLIVAAGPWYGRDMSEAEILSR